MVICRECGKEIKLISATHLAKHNMTRQDYLEKYGPEGLSSNSFLFVPIKTKAEKEVHARQGAKHRGVPSAKIHDRGK